MKFTNETFKTEILKGLDAKLRGEVGDVLLLNVYQNVWVNVVTYSSIASSYDFVISNGLGNSERVIYKQSLNIKRLDNIDIDFELDCTGCDIAYNNITLYVNQFILHSDNSLSFDYLLQQTVKKYQSTPFMFVLNCVVDEYEKMCKCVDGLHFITEKSYS